MRLTAFELFHPAVAGCYFTAVIVLCMLSFQPVFIGISLVAGFACRVCLCGWRATASSIRWQLPLLLIVAVLNPLFSTLGSTELFHIGQCVVHLESFAYGLCMGSMLVSAILWFSNAAHVLTSDKTMSLLGSVLPTVALMISMATRLVPQFVRQATQISTVQKACAVAQPHSMGERGALRLRETSVLMGWSMEDSLETADAMRARGWGIGKRTTYKRYRFRLRDGVALGVVLVLVAICALLAWTACSLFDFYPQMTMLVWWWGYIPYALLLCLPLILWIVEQIRWLR